MDTQNATAAVVTDLLGRFGEGDPARIAELYADEVSWELAWPELEFDGVVPWIRHRSTRADVEDHYRTVAEHTDPSKARAQITAQFVDGTDAVVIGALEQTLLKNGASYRVEFILHLTVTDGLVTRHHIVEDNLTIRRAFDVVD